ncbi:hypothetical protein BGP_3295 [Beggiatoa sp. PS]|nr:hypothetical protein BGP_3295 [Beggiatoa sp. PS]
MLTLTGYRITESLHESANSFIYRAIREKDNQPIVLKILKQEYPPPEKIASPGSNANPKPRKLSQNKKTKITVLIYNMISVVMLVMFFKKLILGAKRNSPPFMVIK